MIIGIVGPIGSGKTLLLTYLAVRAYHAGYHVYSNYQLYNIKYHKLDPERIEGLELEPPSFIALDEAYLWLESRLSSSRLNLALTHLAFQSRKLKTHLAYTSPASIYRIPVDVRLREMSDVIFYARGRSNNAFHYVGLSPKSTFYIKLGKPELIYPHYNTFEILKRNKA